MDRVARAAVAVSIVMFLSACGTEPTGGVAVEVTDGTFTRVTVEEFEPLVTDDDAITVNVHVPEVGSIPGTELAIPFDEVIASGELPADLDRTLAIYCRSGAMSTAAATDLVALGYRDVVELGGGMNAWVESGRTLDRNVP